MKRLARMILIAVLTVIAMGFTVNTGFAAVGRTIGVSSVSESGEANYVIPIFVPPGINGLKPDIALAYAHRADESLAGVGWGITGLSEITRCAKNIATNGENAGVELTNDDRFCLDGNQLMVYSGIYGSNGTTYRTEVNTMARITSNGTAGNGPAWFKVESKDGLIYEYGNTADSRIESLSIGFETTARTWALSEISDRAGNEIRFFYTEDGAPFGSYRIDKIEYRVNASAGLSQAGYRIQFIYETQPAADVDTDYGAGGLIEDEKRLTQIDVINIAANPDEYARRYYLEYEDPLPSTGRSRLESVEECSAGPSDCLPKTTFEYQDGVNGFDNLVSYTPAIPSGVTPIILDINGDGLDDIAWSSSATSGSGDWMFRLSNGTGFGSETNSTIDNDGYSDAIVIDYNQDGKEDLLVPYSGGNWWAVLGDSNGFDTTLVDTGTAQGNAQITAAVDVDGDGREDLVWGENIGIGGQSAPPEIFVKYRDPAGGFDSTATSLFSFSLASGWKIQTMVTANHHWSRGTEHDVNGDGYEDILLRTRVKNPPPQKGFTHRGWVVLGGGAGNTFYQSKFQQARSADFNGDGYRDVAYFDGGLKYRMSTGKGFGPEVSATGGTGGWTNAKTIVIDWDSDGFDDLLAPNSTTGKLDYYRSNGTGFDSQNDTGVSASNPVNVLPADINGDGLTDVVIIQSTNTIAHVLHSGPIPDLMTKATDGQGNYIQFNYESIAGSSTYTKYSSATFPEQDYSGPVHVVKSTTHTDGTGSTYTNNYTYAGAQLNLEGRGLAGFDKKVTTDSRTGNEISEFFIREFPHRGRIYKKELRLDDNTLVQEVSFTWDKLTVLAAENSYFPYLKQSIEKNFEAEGIANSDQINEITIDVEVDTYGTPDKTTRTSIEHSAANGIHSQATYTEISELTSITNSTTTWCLGKANTVESRNSSTLATGSQITRTTNMSWDTGQNCRLDSVTVEPGDVKYELTTSLDYDSFGNVDSRIITGVGITSRSTTINWGTTGQFPVSETNELGQVSQLNWDYRFGVPDTITDPNGLDVIRDYDDFGRLTKLTQSDDTFTDFTLTACNSGNSYCSTSDVRVVTEARSTLNETTGTEIRSDHVYMDQMDRPILEATESMDGSQSYIRTEFDAEGNVKKRSFPYFLGTPKYVEYDYDLIGRLKEVKRDVSDTDSSSQFTKVYYEGLTTKTVDAESREFKIINDVLGRQVRTVDPLGFHVSFDLDAFGSIVKVLDSDSAVLQTSSYEYGIRPFRVSTADADMSASISTENWVYKYNSLGELTGYDDDANPGDTATFTYDKLSRPLTRVESEGTTTWTWGSSASLKNIGRLQSVSSSGVLEEYFYDGNGRISQFKNTLDSNLYQYDYTYGSTNGYLASITYPAINSQRSSIDYIRAHGWLSEIQNASDGSTIWKAQSRDARGNVTSRQASTSANVWSLETSNYDPVTGWLTERDLVADDGSSEDLVFDYEYVYTKTGNLNRRTRLDDLGAKWLEELFYYDSVGRLDYGTYEANGGGVTTHLNLSYLGNGNTDTVQHLGDPSATSYQYSSSKTHAATDFGSDTFSYDDNGNMDDRNGNSATWTSYNKPLTINGDNGSYSTFSYGPSRARYKHVRKYNSNPVETIYYAGLSEDHGELRHNVVADGRIVAQITHDGTNESWLSFHNDHLGSIIAKTSPGTSSDQAFFSATGVRKVHDDWTTNWTPPSGGWTHSEGFTGHEQLYHLSLVHMNGRVYDSDIGRFLSADPLVPGRAYSQAYNRYSYAFNDPLTYTDPSGFVPCFDGVSTQICVNLVGTFLSFLGFGGSSGPVPPPPNYCYLAGPTGCTGAAPSKIGGIFNDIFSLPSSGNDLGIWGPCRYCLSAVAGNEDFQFGRFESEREFLKAIGIGVFKEFVTEPIQEAVEGRVLSAGCKVFKICAAGGRLLKLGDRIPVRFRVWMNPSVRKGIIGEERVANEIGLPRNTGTGRRTIPGSGPGRERIPDFNPDATIRTRGTIVEVKNVEKISISPQLRDMADYAQSRGVPLEIFTNAPKPSRGELRDLIDAGDVILTPIP